MAYGIGPISGCHINPAVSFGVLISGRMKIGDFIGYIIGQFAGGIAAAAVLMVLTSDMVSAGGIAAGSFGQNGFEAGSPGGYGLIPAIVFEAVATFIFVIVILGSTQKEAPTKFAGLAIGLTLVVIHIFGIPITGVSVNPARSLGPALFAGGIALEQVWVFLVVPVVAGILAGLLFKIKLLEK